MFRERKAFRWREMLFGVNLKFLLLFIVFYYEKVICEKFRKL